jgi:hypothetical protein
MRRDETHCSTAICIDWPGIGLCAKALGAGNMDNQGFERAPGRPERSAAARAPS